MKNFIPFALPEIGEEEIAEVIDSLRSGWITTGPKAKQFEQEFSNYLGANVQSLAVNSATSGLHLALEAVGVKPGDQVIVPSYTFTATAEIVRYLGADPVIVDVDRKTFNISVDAIEKAITNETKAIIPVHFAGLACDMDSILSIAKKYDLKVVEDAAHAFPTTYKGSKIGTLDSDATVFSFYANKTMTTGEGGMVVSKNKDIIERCKVMRLHGISRDAFDRYQSKTPSWFYEVVAPGFKYNMPDICAAIGIHQLRKIDDFQKKRQRMAKIYDDALKELPLELPEWPTNASDIHAWHLYPIRLKTDSAINRDDFIKKLSDLGIGCSVHFIPLHKQPVWRDTYNLNASDFPVSEECYLNEISIPL
ncbi:DegT/DnrJ/EryC1/StrS family aminotransferase, partial [Shigella sonnei]|nr:DegT/DnrJ/EryC1/StrS family aminotransferase [Shigella sonnei]EIM4321037.1 DegT/DnrJ/EryC1/StrS family aminotransferase [Shigella sonnei]